MAGDAIDLAQVKRALVVKLRHHGDVLLASPVFNVLKQRAPHLEIDALVYADTAEMLSGHPAIAQVHGIDRAWKSRGPLARAGAELRLWNALRARRYGLLVHLTENRRGMWLAKSLRPAHAVAPRLPTDDPLWSESFSHFYAMPRAGNSRHTAEVNLDALRRIGLAPAEDEKHLILVPGDEAVAGVERRQAGAAGAGAGRSSTCTRLHAGCSRPGRPRARRRINRPASCSSRGGTASCCARRPMPSSWR